MRRAVALSLAIVAAAWFVAPVRAQGPDDNLSIYAVKVVKKTPFREQFTGHGIYLGQGAVLTAAHNIGRWGFLKNPRVRIADQELPARIVSEGSAELDVTLLTVDETRLPVSLRLRRNPLCKQPSKVGASVVVISPDRAARTQIMSPLFAPPEIRRKFNTLISELVGASGSGVFDAQTKCLLGIISRRVDRYGHQNGEGTYTPASASYAGYFVPASQIADFIPREFRF